ncbi:DUF6171 family protein [Singulisphaera sp. PoT]|uniref:DUF6171 family protein n=1 Tax=Singulisphaera sp. PoT TaxID=3411797 RepID=UPI003BF4C58C
MCQNFPRLAELNLLPYLVDTYCEWAADESNRAFLERVLDENEPFPDFLRTNRVDQLGDDQAGAEALELAAPSTLDVDASQRAKSCPFRSCSCREATCGDGGKRPGDTVSLADCAACIRSQDEASAADVPSLGRKALNFGRAVVAHIASGMQSVDDEAYEARLAICRACDRYQADGSCGACGCVLSVKARWADQACPLSKWSAS